MPTFQGSGINEDQIENYEENQEMLKSLTCCICLDIVKNPVECSKCESLYCEECWKLMEISGKDCVLHCKKPIIKANKFVYQILEKLKIKCENCNEGDISYSKYILHEQSCMLSKKFGSISELEKVVKEKNLEIAELEKKKKMLQNNNLEAKIETKYSKEELRKMLITNNLDINEKMALYSYAVEGNLAEFKKCIEERGYPILEEVSAKTFYWTPLHYAMHYGKVEIIIYIMKFLEKKGMLENAMKLESNDNRDPLSCLLKSNAIQNQVKRSTLQAILKQNFQFTISNEVKREIRNRNLEDLLQ
jgi:hypothetical protein